MDGIHIPVYLLLFFRGLRPPNRWKTHAESEHLNISEAGFLVYYYNDGA
jgi:hypothetical protein